MLKMGFALSLLLILSSQGCKPVRQFEAPGAQLRSRLLFAGALAPGGHGDIGMEATWKDGKRLDTEAKGEHRLHWGQFDHRTHGATFTWGSVSLAKDPRKIPHEGAWIEFWVKDQPETITRLDIPTRFDVSLVADFSGSNGLSGMNGSSGRSGTSGSPGAILSSTPAPGGDGEDGCNGEPGQDGHSGERGDDVRAWVTLVPGHTDQLQIKVANGRKERFFRIDGRRGSLLIKADGGNGGEGGRGGDGGRGGSGGVGTPNGRDGRDGHKGPDGFAGRGGNGGSIHLTVDPRAMPFVEAISFSNRGGEPMGHRGPAPVIVEQSVPALWE